MRVCLCARCVKCKSVVGSNDDDGDVVVDVAVGESLVVHLYFRHLVLFLFFFCP